MYDKFNFESHFLENDLKSKIVGFSLLKPRDNHFSTNFLHNFDTL